MRKGVRRNVERNYVDRSSICSEYLVVEWAKLVFVEGVTNYSILFKDGRRHQRHILSSSTT